MPHTNVLVLTGKFPAHDELARSLQPWHHFKDTDPNTESANWRIGGQFSGYLVSKDLYMAIRGEADVSMYQGAPGACDIARVRDLDLDVMQDLHRGRHPDFSRHYSIECQAIVYDGNWYDRSEGTFLDQVAADEEEWLLMVNRFVISKTDHWVAMIDCYSHEENAQRSLITAANK